jgi:hypothetical protein
VTGKSFSRQITLAGFQRNSDALAIVFRTADGDYLHRDKM